MSLSWRRSGSSAWVICGSSGLRPLVVEVLGGVLELHGLQVERVADLGHHALDHPDLGRLGPEGVDQHLAVVAAGLRLALEPGLGPDQLGAGLPPAVAGGDALALELVLDGDDGLARVVGEGELLDLVLGGAEVIEGDGGGRRGGLERRGARRRLSSSASGGTTTRSRKRSCSAARLASSGVSLLAPKSESSGTGSAWPASW